MAERAGQGGWHRTAQTPRVLLDLQSEIGILNYERGLLSFALDPYFAEAPFIYAYYAYRRTSRLSRFSVVDGLIRRESGSALLEMASESAGQHFGGGLRFGPDGLLYLGVGDRSLPETAQDLDARFGKILRLDVRQGTRDQPYRIPPDNPLRGQTPARPEIYAWGIPQFLALGLR